MVDERVRAVAVWNAQSQTMLSNPQALTSALLPGFSLPVRSLLDGSHYVRPRLASPCWPLILTLLLMQGWVESS